jgi:hypothetical protein
LSNGLLGSEELADKGYRLNISCFYTEPLRFLISNHEGHEEYEEKQGVVFIHLRELRVLRG